MASHLPPLFYRSEAIVFLAGMDGQSLSIDNKGELDRKLKLCYETGNDVSTTC